MRKYRNYKGEIVYDSKELPELKDLEFEKLKEGIRKKGYEDNEPAQIGYVNAHMMNSINALNAHIRNLEEILYGTE